MPDQTEPSQVLTWDELRETADDAFGVWFGHPELRWAEEAWGILTSAGLTSYATGQGILPRLHPLLQFGCSLSRFLFSRRWSRRRLSDLAALVMAGNDERRLPPGMAALPEPAFPRQGARKNLIGSMF